jgi:Uncharacterised nucleotidyltransferase
MTMSPGSVLASLLRGIWRHNPPALAISEDELTRVTPLLLRSGGGALGWYRVRRSGLRISVAARTLQQAYRLHALRAAVHEQVLPGLFGALRSVGVEPILIKGWAVARLYPEPGLRPYGDFDLVVRPEQHAAAVTVLNEGRCNECPVDLHYGLRRMHDQRLDALYARSQTMRLNQVDIRILAPEDHLVVLIRHFLRHNAWRPLWLCDIAAALESRPPDFDWDRCLEGSRHRAGWVACTLGLAHQLLDAHVENTPIANRANHLPTWLVPAVLRQWDRCLGAGARASVIHDIASHWRHPIQIVREAYERWDMPIAATVAFGGAVNEFPRLPFQLGLALAHVPIWCQELGSYVKERRTSRAGE